MPLVQEKSKVQEKYPGNSAMLRTGKRLIILAGKAIVALTLLIFASAIFWKLQNSSVNERLMRKLAIYALPYMTPNAASEQEVLSQARIADSPRTTATERHAGAGMILNAGRQMHSDVSFEDISVDTPRMIPSSIIADVFPPDRTDLAFKGRFLPGPLPAGAAKTPSQPLEFRLEASSRATPQSELDFVSNNQVSEISMQIPEIKSSMGFARTLREAQHANLEECIRIWKDFLATTEDSSTYSLAALNLAMVLDSAATLSDDYLRVGNILDWFENNQNLLQPLMGATEFDQRCSALRERLRRLRLQEN